MVKDSESGSAQARQAIAQTLQHWKADPDLVGLREPDALAKLTADEQKACRALWAQVERSWRSCRATNPNRAIRIRDGRISATHAFCVAVMQSIALRGCVEKMVGPVTHANVGYAVRSGAYQHRANTARTGPC